ncbi:MAG: hypothetical protein NVSMB51_06660 [Solirubrobacteraceae bacterium]
MSQENVNAVRAANAAFNAHDTEGWLNALDPAFEFVDHMGAVAEASGSGIAAIRGLVEGWLDTFPDFQQDTVEFIDAGDRVVCATRWQGTGAGSGLEYRQAAAELYTLRGGKIIRAELGFTDKHAALAAARTAEPVNVEAFRRGVKAINRGDADAAVADAAESVVLLPHRSPVEGAYRGHSGIRRFVVDNAESFEEFRVMIDEVREVGDCVLAVGTIRIRGRGSGVETSFPTAGIATFERGKLSRWEDFGERRLALQAAGLAE